MLRQFDLNGGRVLKKSLQGICLKCITRMMKSICVAKVQRLTFITYSYGTLSSDSIRFILQSFPR